jgi:hypothetical protein
VQGVFQPSDASLVLIEATAERYGVQVGVGRGAGDHQTDEQEFHGFVRLGIKNARAKIQTELNFCAGDLRRGSTALPSFSSALIGAG